MSLGHIATEGFLNGSLGLVATEGYLGEGGGPVIPPVEPPTRILGGRPGGVRRKKYVPPIEDTILNHERMQQILREDEEIIEFIKVILTKGLI